MMLEDPEPTFFMTFLVGMYLVCDQALKHYYDATMLLDLFCPIVFEVSANRVQITPAHDP